MTFNIMLIHRITKKGEVIQLLDLHLHLYKCSGGINHQCHGTLSTLFETYRDSFCETVHMCRSVTCGEKNALEINLVLNPFPLKANHVLCHSRTRKQGMYNRCFKQMQNTRASMHAHPMTLLKTSISLALNLSLGQCQPSVF